MLPRSLANRGAGLPLWKGSGYKRAWTAHCRQQEFRDRFPDLGVVFGAYDLVGGQVRLPISLRAESQTKKEVCSPSNM
jgi:hypothetical protein